MGVGEGGSGEEASVCGVAAAASVGERVHPV